MAKRSSRIGIGVYLNAATGVAFVLVAAVIVSLINHSMRQQALLEAESKARILLDRNLATHTYFSHNLKPAVFELTDPTRPADYFDPAWMSSTYAVREIDKYSKALSPSDYYYKECAVNARSSENEADEYERTFIAELNADPKLTERTVVRTLNGKPYFVTLRRGEVMEESCLRCHSTPGAAPQGLVDLYGAERSFSRSAGEVISAISIRVPLATAYAEANRISLQLSGLLLSLLLALFLIQSWLNNRMVLAPLTAIRNKTHQIASDESHLGEEIASPPGKEFGDLAADFNLMSRQLRQERDMLETRVKQRTEQLQSEIARRTRIQDELRQQNTLLNNTLESLSHPFYVIDASDYTVKLANSAAKALGTLAEGTTCYALSHRAQGACGSESHPCPLEEVQRTKQPAIVEHVHCDKDGNPRNFEVHGYPVFDDGGNVVQMIEYSLDVTERKQAERALQTSEARYRGLFDHSLSAVAVHEIVTDSDGKPVDYIFLEVNPAFHIQTGLRPDQVIGKRATEAIPGLEKTPFIGIYGKVALTGEPVEFEQFSEPMNRHYQVSAFSLGGGRFATVFRDITARKQADDEREQLIGGLQDALSQVKQLSGLLPICASCKKIRDDDGYWQHVEEYIRERSEAEFSHGICPDCARKLYPEMFND